MKFWLVAAFLLAVAVCAGCGKGDNVDDQNDALKLAMVALGFAPEALPPVLNDLYPCDIPVRIQPSPPATPVTSIRGECKWTVAPRGSGWRIVFGEKWPCEDWSILVDPWKPCQVPMGSHSWTMQVNLLDGSVARLAEVGTFAPDMPR